MTPLTPLEVFQDHFPGKSTVVLPVIHVCRQTHHLPINNVQIAYESGADGIFVINHGTSFHDLYPLICRIKDKYPDKWLGANFLGCAIESVFYPWPPPYVDGIWSDSLHFEFREKVKVFDGLYFGPFAFKAGKQIADQYLEEGARAHLPYIDVLTTSGPATGYEPSEYKIQRIRNAIGDTPLAIASGISPENASIFLPYANAFLVATGISCDFEHLDRFKTEKLIQIVSDYRGKKKHIMKQT